MTYAVRDRLLLWAPGLALACGAMVVALEEPSANRLASAALVGVSVVLVWSVAVAVRLRYPERRLGLLLFVLAGAYAIQTLIASPDPRLYTMARAVRPAVEVLLLWIMLAFPSGSLLDWRARAIVWGGFASVALLWIPGLMFTPRIPMAGSFVLCHADCPRNVLFVADWPMLSWALVSAFRLIGTLLLVGTAALLTHRLVKATPLLRRALAPVLVASIARTLVLAGFLISDGTQLEITFTFWAIPLAIGLGFLRGRLYTAKALQQLVTGLRARPSVGELRHVMAGALDDPELSIAYWMKDAERWVDANGQPVTLSYPNASGGRVVRIVNDAQGRPVAALLHDAALLETPALVDAVAGSMLMALESQRVETELKGTRSEMASAVEEERHRIERDLHDGAQQRLIAMRMKVGVAARLLDHDTRRASALLGELGQDVDAAIVELRALAHGIAPPQLVESGLGDALRDAAARAAIPVRCEIGNVGRCDARIERAVYFCCLEALQNAAKHAGADAVVTLTLARSPDGVAFSVEDDGGAGPAGSFATSDGQGIANMRDRMRAIGGTLELGTLPGGGLRVAGSAPV